MGRYGFGEDTPLLLPLDRVAVEWNPIKEQAVIGEG